MSTRTERRQAFMDRWSAKTAEAERLNYGSSLETLAVGTLAQMVFDLTEEVRSLKVEKQTLLDMVCDLSADVGALQTKTRRLERESAMRRTIR